MKIRNLTWKGYSELSDKDKKDIYIPPGENPKEGRFAFERGEFIKVIFPHPLFTNKK